MPPFQQLAIIPVLLLACSHSPQSAAGAAMSESAPDQPLWCNQCVLTNQSIAIQQTSREADIAIRIAHYLLHGRRHEPQYKIAGLKENGECETIVLPSPPLPHPVLNTSLQYTADTLWNLNHLLQLYHSAWKLMDLNEGYSEESNTAKLDFLGIAFFRFSNQVERYLQIYNCSCEGTNCTVHQNISKESIQEIMQRELPAECSWRKFLGKIIALLKEEAKVMFNVLLLRHGPQEFVPWSFCDTVEVNPLKCK